MNTQEQTFLYLLADLIAKRIANNRMGIYRLMERENDPLPQPIILSEGQKIPNTDRYAGRRVAWIGAEVENWLSRRPRAGKATA